ncbi:MAG: Uma2 family endonuclease [Hyphomonadaceae bacterium]|nr:Uma2 family endonuclease [Hyphomonadaceae bacterium]
MNKPVRPPLDEPQEMRFAYEEFVQLGESRAFGEGVRVELRRGRLVEMPSEGSIHLYVRSRLIRLFSALSIHLPPGVAWITDPTVRFSADDVSIPDFTFGAEPKRDTPYAPTDLQMVIEVGVTTARYDRTTKRADYAAAGIPAYWLIEPADQPGAGLVRVHLNPVGGDFGDVSIARAGDELALPFAPSLKIAVADFL